MFIYGPECCFHDSIFKIGAVTESMKLFKGIDTLAGESTHLKQSYLPLTSVGDFPFRVDIFQTGSHKSVSL